VSRYDNGGFPVADVATDLPSDSKIRALWRILHRQSLMTEARTLWEDVRLASWREGERLTVEESASSWLDPNPKVVAAMVQVGLLDESHRITEKAWEGWYTPARERRDKAKAASRVGNRARWGSDRPGIADGSERDPDATPTGVRPESGRDPRPVPSRPVPIGGTPEPQTPSRVRPRGEGVTL